MYRCVICGAALNERDGDVTAAGLRCWSCSARAEIEGHEQAIADRARLRSERRAELRRRSISVAHGLIWLVSALVLHDSFGGAYRAWSWPLVVAGMALAIALYLRQKWAYYATLGLDGAAALAPLIAAVCSSDDGGWIFAVFLSLIPSLLVGDLVWRRRTFGIGAAPEVLQAPAVTKKWELPGRQL